MYRTIIRISVAAFAAIQPAIAENIEIDGRAYEMQRLIERQISPGVTQLRIRIPAIPLNANLVMVDLTNPNVRVENVPANGLAKGQETLASATARMAAEGHKPVAAQNANFWICPPAVDNAVFSGTTRSLSLSNGQMCTECNMYTEKAFGGPRTSTGLLGITTDGEAYADFANPEFEYIIGEGTTRRSIYQCNKGVGQGEVSLYNSFQGRDRQFKLIDNEASPYSLVSTSDAREVMLDLAEGETWRDGDWMTFDVKEVRDNAGHGCLGAYDAALVGRGANTLSRRLTAEVGGTVKIRYAVTFDPDGSPIQKPLAQGIGGNLLLMRGGQPLEACKSNDYDSMTYARSLYGTSADHRTLYMIVIDKSTDPSYGRSAGMSCWDAAFLARHFGCANLIECDGGGSAQQWVVDRVINKTTEASPRAVGNSLMVFDTTPSGIMEAPAADYGKLVTTVEDGSLYVSSAGLVGVRLYSAAGAEVDSAVAEAGCNAVRIAAPKTAGVYIVAALTGNGGRRCAKIVIK